MRSEQQGGEKLLIVDDDESSRRTLSLVLRQSKYVPLEAASGAEALAMWEREAPAAVLLDVKLPDQSGTDVLAMLRSRDPDLLAIMITAHASMEVAVEALNMGASAFIVKPLNLDDVLATIAQLLEKRRLVIENRELQLELQQELEERRRAEAERDLLVKAMESSADGIVVTDAAGKVLHANAAFQQITGYALKEVVGRKLDLLRSAHQDDEYFQRIEESLRQRGSWSGLLVSKRKDGEEYREECTITPVINQAGDVANYAYVRRDVTNKLELEAIAEAVNTMSNIGYVFSGIRHELGNPINSATMTLKMLKGRFEQYDPQEVGDYLERVLDELARVRFLLHSLKSFNMNEDVAPARVEIAAFTQQFLVLAEGDCRKRGVSIAVSVEPPELVAFADSRALQQVLLNVLTNALDACVDGAEPAIELEARQKRGGVSIVVSDNGCGMNREEQLNLFRPFVTSKSHGTGLGLVIARKMMSQMNGSIGVTSTLGQGTRVELWLPEAGE